MGKRVLVPRSPELLQLHRGVSQVVRTVGEQVLAYAGPSPQDTRDYHGHEESSIDGFARSAMNSAIEHYLPFMEGKLRFELLPFEKSLLEEPEHGNRRERWVCMIDEIDGTTNTKRMLASTFKYTPRAGVSFAVSATDKLEGLQAGAFYAMNQDTVLSALRWGDESFISFDEGTVIYPDRVQETRGDSRHRIIVAGYSNSHRLKKGELEQRLYDQRLKTYEGCRSSSVDVLDVIRNQFDAYVDCRSFWSTRSEDGTEQEAMLQVYDVAAIIPVAIGCGLCVSDAQGQPWQKYDLMDQIPLVVSRPGIHQLILETIQPLIAEWQKAQTQSPNEETSNG